MSIAQVAAFVRRRCTDVRIEFSDVGLCLLMPACRCRVCEVFLSGFLNQGEIDWKDQSKYRSRTGSALDANFAAVILNDFLHDREPETGSILFSAADEGFEEPVAY